MVGSATDPLFLETGGRSAGTGSVQADGGRGTHGLDMTSGNSKRRDWDSFDP